MAGRNLKIDAYVIIFSVLPPSCALRSLWPWQFALVPRAHASVFFNAWRSLHVCVPPGSELQRRWFRDTAGGPEQVLWKHLADYGVPARFYPFPYVIVRPMGARGAKVQPSSLGGTPASASSGGGGGDDDGVGGHGGGVCASLWNHLSELCVVSHDTGNSPWQEPWQGGVQEKGAGLDPQPGGGVADCSFALFKASEQVCRDRFPGRRAPSTEAQADARGRVEHFEQRGELGRVHATLQRARAALDAASQGGAWPRLPGGPHPVILTSTGGEQQSGQVATAAVLTPGQVGLVAEALRCVVGEFGEVLGRMLGRMLDGTGDTGWGDGLALCSGALHEAEMALGSAALLHVTCLGGACTQDGEDYQRLANALRHALA